MAPQKSKSTLTDHCFPAFYACYLLKSIRTPKSTATYIGSTPSPPRRIRQHNGEISQGAWKTKHNRPWVMQMIVHGFPSKLAALQFEWAWQHPHISRHLKDDDGKAVFARGRGNKYLRTNVHTARSMTCSHPYNTWPLHVKLFTEEALKAWTEPAKNSMFLPLPPGLTVVTEFEGVDGKSGKTGSGRIGPINVTDETFTSEHLKKTLNLNSLPLKCSICQSTIDNLSKEPLNYALCPASECTAVSHIRCLAKDFLSSSTSKVDIIPRGGTCRKCHTYVLWGDVIRGCYRRRKGGADLIEDPEPEEDFEESEASDISQPDREDSDPDSIDMPLRKMTQTGESRKPKGKGRALSPVAGTSKKTAKERTRSKPSPTRNATYSTVAKSVIFASHVFSSDEEDLMDLDVVTRHDGPSRMTTPPAILESRIRKPRFDEEVLTTNKETMSLSDGGDDVFPTENEDGFETAMSALSVSSPAHSDGEQNLRGRAVIVISD